MNWKAIMTFALLFVTPRMYTSPCRMYMKLQEPSTRTGVRLAMLSASLELMMCERKAAARFRLQGQIASILRLLK
jgi:hypothetical protein